MARVVCWISAGAPSAVAAKMVANAAGGNGVVLAYCQTGAEHPDNERFLSDIERWIGLPVERLQSTEYSDTWDVWERRRYLAGINGAPCTGILKLAPRLAFQKPNDTHVFGYTDDAKDRKRASLLRENFFELNIQTPLIERHVNRKSVLAIIENADIRLPAMYGMGFPNNNCIPCVKATSPNYWSAMRLHFPAQFQRMARLSRELDVRLCRIADERKFIDEIPVNWPTLNPEAPSCDFLCQLVEQNISAFPTPPANEKTESCDV